LSLHIMLICGSNNKIFLCIMWTEHLLLWYICRSNVLLWVLYRYFPVPFHVLKNDFVGIILLKCYRCYHDFHVLLPTAPDEICCWQFRCITRHNVIFFSANLAENLMDDLQKEGLKGKTLTLKLKTVDFEVWFSHPYFCWLIFCEDNQRRWFLFHGLLNWSMIWIRFGREQ